MISRFLIIASILALVGCSSGGELKLKDQSSQLQSSYESVKVVINPTAKDSGEILEDLRSSVTGQLLSLGRFRKLSLANESADIVITIDIVGYERVTVGERILVGVFAGRNRIIANVSVADGKNGAIIRSFEASGKSAAHPLSSEAGYGDALREVSKEISLGLSSS